MKVRKLLALILLAAMAAHAGEAYRWKDKDGVVHYGDSPGSVEAEKLNINAPPEPDASAVEDAKITYGARDAARHFPVTIYVFKDCGAPCDQGRAYLRKRGVPFTEKMLATQEEFDAFRKRTGMGNLPVLEVGQTYREGFLQNSWSSALDEAGFPK